MAGHILRVFPALRGSLVFSVAIIGLTQLGSEHAKGMEIDMGMVERRLGPLSWQMVIYIGIKGIEGYGRSWQIYELLGAERKCLETDIVREELSTCVARQGGPSLPLADLLRRVSLYGGENLDLTD